MEIAAAALPLEQVEACRSSDDRTVRLRRVFEASCDGLYRYILVRVGGNRHDADDLLQQTCCIAVGHRGVPADDGECEAWLRGVAKNLIRKHWREAKRSGRQIPLEDAELAGRLAEDMGSRPLPPDQLAKKESVAQLLLATTSLAAADQELIFAFYFDGRSQAEIAEASGATVKSIEAKLYRARHRLRSKLERLGRMDES